MLTARHIKRCLQLDRSYRTFGPFDDKDPRFLIRLRRKAPSKKQASYLDMTHEELIDELNKYTSRGKDVPCNLVLAILGDPSEMVSVSFERGGVEFISRHIKPKKAKKKPAMRAKKILGKRK